MKTLQESIIGRKGSPVKFTKDRLRPGYIVKYRNNPYGKFGMYFSLEDIEKYQDTKTFVISHVITHLQRDNDMGVFISKDSGVYPNWNPLAYYSEDLLSDGGKSGKTDFDIIEVYPIKMKPEFLSSQELEKLIRNINPIRINQ